MARKISTKQRQAKNNALAASQEQTFKILESVADPFFAVDHQWRFTHVNRAAAERWGRRRDDLIGKDFWEAFPQALGPEPAKCFRRPCRSVSLRGSKWCLQFCISGSM